MTTHTHTCMLSSLPPPLPLSLCVSRHTVYTYHRHLYLNCEYGKTGPSQLWEPFVEIV